ncbi:M14 metallopeptidase family protein [Lutibacter sp.]|uniref:M14 metallopeptidase family protein n=1 Tax=Lutibacter sp. TaxID=1925666 RepID=UPI001A1B89DF|nr:M14 metallopeptidase family protein [Lutibacter sp.]MBI9041269.1 zinc carboxypeptidase [Lutibacter sp.]
MKKLLISIIFLLTIGISATKAQQIVSPSEFLGYELGSRFTNHLKIVDYFSYISANSSNVIVEKYGMTNENRPLFISYISSEENIKNLEQIRQDNLSRTKISNGNIPTKISIVWLSYNVHGNEASSTEASMATLYKLITENKDWLQNTVVIIDPCLNPDGRDRYVNWFNQVKNTPYTANPDAIEHNEPWPGGRPNHYLFDLNRDWAWATQVETQQRIKIYNKWMPQIHVDFHEQFVNNPYYFAPAAEPSHEIITNWQREFQSEIGKNHAKYFDKNGWRYFTKEAFDLLYPSYGDSYPMFMGAIGMTYEQAGHGKAGLGILIENNSELTLKDRIEHHTTTGLSTIEMAAKNTSKLIAEFEKFFDNSKMEVKNYILKGDFSKISSLTKLLDQHEINYFSAKENTVKAYDYYSKNTKNIQITKNDLIVPTNQPKGKMMKVLFEPETKLMDSLTYDITAWSLPFAYGLQGFSTNSELTTSKFLSEENKKTNTVENAYAYIHKWNAISDAAFLGTLITHKINVRYSNADFSIEGNNYTKGSLVILKNDNEHLDNFNKLINTISTNLNETITAVSSGFVESGFDFGSSNYTFIKPKNVVLLSGETISPYSFGEVWHFFETQLKYPVTVLNSSSIGSVNLLKYNVLILPEGYAAKNEELESITEFTKNGGNVIAIGSALNNFSDKKDFLLKMKKDTITDKKTPNLVPFKQQERNYLNNIITGSIFKSIIDTTHPLAFGYDSFYYSLKLSGTSYKLFNEGINVGYFPENATNISGFAGSKALKDISNSLLFGIENKGKGQLIYMVDNPLFRSFWENGKLFFANAVFLN